MFLWVDDFSRPPSDDWCWVTSSDDAIRILEKSEVSVISLDHNLRDAHYLGNWKDGCTGYDVLMWIHAHPIPGLDIRVHSIDIASSGRMMRALKLAKSASNGN